MNFFKLFVVLTAFVIAKPLIATSGTEVWTVNSEQSPVTFLAIGKPGFLRIRGENGKLQGKAEITGDVLSGGFTVELGLLTTGISLRDEHMRKNHLEITKFPVAELKINAIKLAKRDSVEDLAFAGTLIIKEVEKAVTGKVSLAGLKSKQVTGKANFEISITDYPALGVPKYLGVTVADKLEIDVVIVASRSEQDSSPKSELRQPKNSLNSKESDG